MSKRRQRRKQKREAKGRESGFNMRFTQEKVPEYNALYDANLRHYFENRTIQTNLYNNGLIDREGRVIDMDKNKAKLAIIEQEFKHAERAEYWRMKEEEDMRKRVQKKRHDALEASRRAEQLAKMKEDARIRKDILRAAREAVQVPKPVTKASRARRRKKKEQRRAASQSPDGGGGGFFITDASGFERQGGGGGGSGGYGDASQLIGGGEG